MTAQWGKNRQQIKIEKLEKQQKGDDDRSWRVR